ncbi:MAG: diguanylate cyclase, partial [Anaerolineales bacterium]|nr:diguanylate cyclase [Anaerolineales bacterium]
MGNAAMVLIVEAMVMYFIVLGAHALRTRYGMAPYFALLGGITAIMSWVTDAGLSVSVAGITFMVGSTIFYTSLLLGVFVVYVFDGPSRTRLAISTVLGISILMPLVAAVLHWQSSMIGQIGVANIPSPSLRINAASVLTTSVDLIFLGIAWELLGKPRLRMGLWMRTYLTLLGVMCLDVLLFNTGAFAGTPGYLSIMGGTLISRFFISILAVPFLYGYISWQSKREEVDITARPVLAILDRFFQIEAELSQAQREIERREKAERERQRAMVELRSSREAYKALSETLRKVSTTDELTGIYNRRFFNEMLQKEWNRAIREHTELSVLIMDVDNFKTFNDRYGHLGGDRLLQRLAEELWTQFRRPADLFSRFGGDEFAAILPATHQVGAQTVAKNCRRHLESIRIGSQ